MKRGTKAAQGALLFKDFTAEYGEEGGTVKGYAATFDREPDSYGDVIAAGAFEKTLERWARNGHPIPLLYGHNMSDPDFNIGSVTLAREDERGLYVEASFDADSAKAQYVRKLVKEGRLYQFSFAYDVKAAGEVELADGRKANELRELDIYEVSLVQVPANQHAEVVDAKAGEPDVKAGKRNSKADEDSIREAIRLLQGVLGDLAEDEGDDEGKAKSEGDPAKYAGTGARKQAILDVIAKIEND